MDWGGGGLNKTNSPVVGGALGYEFHSLPGPSMQWRPCPPFPNLQFPKMAKLGIKSFARTPGAWASFRCICFDVSSVFWFFFQAKLIIIHPHRLNLASHVPKGGGRKERGDGGSVCLCLHLTCTCMPTHYVYRDSTTMFRNSDIRPGYQVF